MSFVGDLFNSSKGAGYQANGATTDQTNQAFTDAQNGLSQQNAFTQALQAQNGIGNQSSVYNQLQGVANGTGPNPAQAMLNQQTANNVSNQAAMAAGQRGASSNVGLIARQAGMTGGNLQQQAVGQAATMQANQSLGALGQMGSIAGQQVQNQANATNAYSSAAQNEQGTLYGSLNNQNSANASIASGNAANQAKMFGGLTNGIASGLAMNQGGKVPHMASGGSVSGNTNPAAGAKSGVGQFFSGATKSQPSSDIGATKGAGDIGTQSQNIGSMIGRGIGSLFSSTPAAPIAGNSMAAYQGLNDFGNNAQDYNNITDVGQAQADGISAMDPIAANPGASSGIMDALSSAGPAAMAMSRGGNVPQGKQVPVVLSPGEKVLDPREAVAVVQGQESIKSVGKVVPGQAKVAGDSLKNDVVPTTAEEDSIVIPRSHMKDMSSALKFVHAHMNREKALALGKK